MAADLTAVAAEARAMIGIVTFELAIVSTDHSARVSSLATSDVASGSAAIDDAFLFAVAIAIASVVAVVGVPATARQSEERCGQQEGSMTNVHVEVLLWPKVRQDELRCTPSSADDGTVTLDAKGQHMEALAKREPEIPTQVPFFRYVSPKSLRFQLLGAKDVSCHGSH